MKKWSYRMREREIERRLKNEVEKAGGLCLKFTSPGFDGVPDRIILLPKGKITFIELKAPGEKPRPLQTARIEKLRDYGFRVEVLDSKEEIVELVKQMKGES
jgi:VRR-NUC domain.